MLKRVLGYTFERTLTAYLSRLKYPLLSALIVSPLNEYLWYCRGSITFISYIPVYHHSTVQSPFTTNHNALHILICFISSLYIHAYAHTHVYVYIYTYVIHIYTYVMYIYIHMLCIYTYIYIHMLYIYIYVCMYVCMYVCIYMYVYIIFICKIWFVPFVPWLPSSVSNHDGKWLFLWLPYIKKWLEHD